MKQIMHGKFYLLVVALVVLEVARLFLDISATPKNKSAIIANRSWSIIIGLAAAVYVWRRERLKK